MIVIGASPPGGANDGESTIMDGDSDICGAIAGCRELSTPGGADGDDVAGGAWGLTALRSTTVLLLVVVGGGGGGGGGGGSLDGDVPPSRGPSSLAARVDGGAARASLNLEVFWARARAVGAGTGSVPVAGEAAGGGRCPGGAP